MQLSIIIPVYNTDIDLLKRCLYSCLCQNLEDFEVIAINDGSTHPEVALFLDCLKTQYPKLQVFHRDNSGLGEAFNFGILVARGEYIAFSDHDDFYAAGALKELYHKAKAYDCDIAMGQPQRFPGQSDIHPVFKEIYQDERIIEKLEYDTLILWDIHYWGKVIRKSFIQAHGLDFLSNNSSADLLFMVKCFGLSKNIYISPYTTFFWHRTPNSLSKQKSFFIDRLIAIQLACKHLKTINQISLPHVLGTIFLHRLSWYINVYLGKSANPDNFAAFTYYIPKIFELCEMSEEEFDKYVSSTRWKKFWLAMLKKDFNKAKALYFKTATLHATYWHRLKALSRKVKTIVYKFLSQCLRKRKNFPAIYATQLLKPAKNKVFFEVNFGKQYAGSPRAIYEKLLEMDLGYEFVWCYENSENAELIPGSPHIVKRNSESYFKHLGQSNYLVNNIMFPLTQYRKDAVYLQTWHGTPLKRLGWDIEIEGPEVRARDYFYTTSRNWTYLLAANDYSKKRFLSAFKHTAQTLTLGYPANDIFYSEDRAKKVREKMIHKLGLPTDKKIILYAPTWRDNKAEGFHVKNVPLPFDIPQWHKKFGGQYVILSRLHHLTSMNAKTLKLFDNDFIFDVSHIDDVWDLMVITDVLISDYSSIYFDFACTRRPILFYLYDYAEYMHESRGTYFDMRNTPPGPICYDEDSLIHELENIHNYNERFGDNYHFFYERFCSLHDGKSTDRVIKSVFNLSPLLNKK